MDEKDKSHSPPSSDDLEVGDVDKGSAVALGRGARAEVKIFNKKIYIDLRLLPLVFVLAVAVGILAYFQLREDIPDTMQGEFNVAIAEFTVLDENGTVIHSDEGMKLAQWLYQRLNHNFSELDIQYEIWPPNYTGKIDGSTAAEREIEAEARAKEIQAHVVIYGIITASGDHSKFSPEFFVNTSGFDEGEEITGQHELGDALLIALPFDPNQLQDVENPALSARAEALSLIAVGLAYYSIDAFDSAISYFSKAEAITGWRKTAGKEVVYLLLGNANVRLSSKEKTPKYLEASLNFYNAALIVNPEYTRAILGQASTEYLLALGNPNNTTFTDVDLKLLDSSKEKFKQALEFGDPPKSANVEAKVHFGLGQIYLVREQVLGENLLVKAKSEFEQVINEYENGNERIANIAGHAYARLGLIARLENNTSQALNLYKNAVNLVSPFYQAYYTTRIGEVYVATGETNLAITAYEDAIQIAEFYGDESSIEKYLMRLNELKKLQ